MLGQIFQSYQEYKNIADIEHNFISINNIFGIFQDYE